MPCENGCIPPQSRACVKSWNFALLVVLFGLLGVGSAYIRSSEKIDSLTIITVCQLLGSAIFSIAYLIGTWGMVKAKSVGTLSNGFCIATTCAIFLMQLSVLIAEDLPIAFLIANSAAFCCIIVQHIVYIIFLR